MAARPTARDFFALRTIVQVANGDLADQVNLNAAQSPLLYAFRCFPRLPRFQRERAGKQERPRGTIFSLIAWLGNFGAKGFEPSSPTFAGMRFEEGRGDAYTQTASLWDRLLHVPATSFAGRVPLRVVELVTSTWSEAVHFARTVLHLRKAWFAA
jgi:hypothetical protein